MKNILILKTSARDSSISASLAQEFTEAMIAQGNELSITTRDLSRDQLPNLDNGMTMALRAGKENLTANEADAIAISDEMIAELEAADMILVAAPMHNFTISAQMRTWIDYVTRPGKTFGYSEAGPKGLLTDKAVYVFSSRGGQYGDGSPEAPNPHDFQSGYLRHIFGFMGISSVEIIAANGMDMGDEPKAIGLLEARKKIEMIIASQTAANAA